MSQFDIVPAILLLGSVAAGSGNQFGKIEQFQAEAKNL